MLRADPDVIMVGEIRDAETARIGIEAALTGHMVLTTLHTNDAPGAITRLQEMGIESFLTSSALECVVAQRLGADALRALQAAHGRQPRRRSRRPASGWAPTSRRMSPSAARAATASGYRGRLGIYSVMVLTERIKELVVNLASEAEIASAAIEEGMLTLRQAGMEKVRSGMTSVQEVSRVTS